MDSKNDSKNPFAADTFAAPAMNPFAQFEETEEERLAHAAEGTYEYALLRQAPAPAEDETESKDMALEITVRWGKSVLHVAHVSPPRSYVVGEGGDFFLPEEKIGAAKLEVVNVRDGQVRIARGAEVVVLEAGKTETVKLGDISIAVGLVRAGKKVRGALDIGKKGWSFTGLSGVLHAAILGGAAMFMPPLAGASTDGISVDQQAMLQQYLAKAAEKEQKELEGEQAEQKEDKAASGGRAPGSEGAAGNPVAKPANARMAIKGDKNNTDIRLNKADAVQDAANFGFIGILSSLEGQMGPKSPLGDFASGNDPVNAMGHLWGPAMGDAYGSGLGLTSTGEGGGGRDGIIGVGDKIGGLGTCMGENCGGAGFSRGRLTRGHKPSGIKVRPQGITSVGVLPAEVIQRVVRQNFGRFRLCYENGLRNNPNLAGRVAVRFVIGRDGAASGAGNGGSDMPDAGVVSCVVRSFNGLSFPAPEAGIVTVTYPIAFSSN